MIRMILEGQLTADEAATLAKAVNNRFSREHLLRAEVGSRHISTGGLDPVLGVALAGLAIKVAEFLITLWKSKNQHQQPNKEPLAELGSAEKKAVLEVFAPVTGDEVRLVRHDGIWSLSEPAGGHCTLVFSVAGKHDEFTVIAQVRGTVESCVVFLAPECP